MGKAELIMLILENSSKLSKIQFREVREWNNEIIKDQIGIPQDWRELKGRQQVQSKWLKISQN